MMASTPNVTIYADGSCLGNPGPGGWSAITISGANVTEQIGGDRHTTNNRMELLGVINGLRALTEPCCVSIISDSKYVTDAFNKSWIGSWKKNGWSRSSGELLNADLWKELDGLVSKHDCTFVWVKGHNGNKYNERADALAVAESNRQACGEHEAEAADVHDILTAEEPGVVCLEQVLAMRNTEKYGVERPCGADLWCEVCDGTARRPCAAAYMRFTAPMI